MGIGHRYCPAIESMKKKSHFDGKNCVRIFVELTIVYVCVFVYMYLVIEIRLIFFLDEIECNF